MKIHLLPTANSGSRKHFVDTIKNRVLTKVIRKHVKDKSITSLLTLNSYPCWGVTNGGQDRNKNQWLQMNPGDIGLFYASVRHGLDIIDPDKIPDISKKDGRWWFGLNVHNSDEMDKSKRHTTSPYHINKNI